MENRKIIFRKLNGNMESDLHRERVLHACYISRKNFWKSDFFAVKKSSVFRVYQTVVDSMIHYYTVLA